jgi:hypothetical protein
LPQNPGALTTAESNRRTTPHLAAEHTLARIPILPRLTSTCDNEPVCITTAEDAMVLQQHQLLTNLYLLC